MKFGINVVFEKIFDTYFFSFLIEGVKTTLNVGGQKHILSNISERYSFLFKLVKLVFLNGVCYFAKKSFV